MKGWASDLVPKSLVVARYFAKEQAVIDKLRVDLETIGSKKTELEEEHSDDEGAFADMDKINRGNVIGRMKEIKDDPESKEEAGVLNEWLELCNQETELKTKLKEAEASLDGKAYNHYPKLSEAEIQILVVDDKWLAAVDAAIHNEMDRISHSLTQRVTELAERYESPLPKQICKVATLETKVKGHLEAMGFSWT